MNAHDRKRGETSTHTQRPYVLSQALNVIGMRRRGELDNTFELP